MLESSDLSQRSSEYKKFRGRPMKLGRNYYNAAAKSYGRRPNPSIFEEIPEADSPYTRKDASTKRMSPTRSPSD